MAEDLLLPTLAHRCVGLYGPAGTHFSEWEDLQWDATGTAGVHMSGTWETCYTC